MKLVDEIEQSWGWVGIEPEEIVGENDFGNLMIRDRHGRYWRLCPEDVYCKVVAENRQELGVVSQDEEFLEDWCMQALVDQARAALGPLREGHKYYLVIPGLLGGKYDLSNIKTAPLVEIVRFSGDIGRQLRDLPDGSQVELKIVD